MLPCRDCAYRTSIPGNAHIRCRFDWARLPDAIPTTDARHAISAGWFMFPFNYDPVWGPDECSAKSEVAEHVAKPNPLADLLSLLG